MQDITPAPAQFVTDSDWIGFPGGELEGKRPKVLCPACRDDVGRGFLARRSRGEHGWARRPGSETRRLLCFRCYRAEIDRDRALKAAGQVDTASADRFQTALPFEPVNRPRLEMLKAERSTARARTAATPSGNFADRRRQAQIAARRALRMITASLGGNNVGQPALPGHEDRARKLAAAIHAAELQLPESWLPFVVCR
jgi:hypothetical protein